MDESHQPSDRRLRLGAVTYLNSKPLVYGLEQARDDLELLFDLPSRLADSLAAGRLDAALIPAVEWFQNPDYRVVSDACVACRGPVLSVKLQFRVPPPDVRRLALDEGSRTSAALARILLLELHGCAPAIETLPIGASAADSTADAVLLIGDRAMHASDASFVEIWDLGDRWCRWAELPFVFAMWVARPGIDIESLALQLAGARDQGVLHLNAIAAENAARLKIDQRLAEDYLHHNLHFRLGTAEERGLARFHELCARHGLLGDTVSRFAAESIEN